MVQEERIVSGLKRHDEKCLEDVMRLYGKLVYFVISKIIGKDDGTVSEELASDTFMSIWNKAEYINLSKGTLKNLTCTIARNNAKF